MTRELLDRLLKTHFTSQLSAFIVSVFYVKLQLKLLMTVAARSKARTIFALSNYAIQVSNPTRGVDVCAFILCLCFCV
jgi:hypothetical protein